VHARAVVVPDRLGHEGGRLAVPGGDVFDDVLVPQQVVGVCSSGPYFMSISHCPPVATSWCWASTSTPHSISVSIISVRRSCSVSAGGTGSNPPCSGSCSRRCPCPLWPAAVPLPFGAVDVVVGLVLVLVEADVVEHEKLGFRAEVRRRRRCRSTSCSFRFAGNVARIFGIVLARDRILDVAGHRQRLLHERIDDGGLRLRHDEHVALVDRLPAAHATSRRTQTLPQTTFRQGLDGNREMLLRAGKIHEPQVDGPDFLFAAKGEHFYWSEEFTQEQVNSWLSEELYPKYEKLVPEGIDEPRVRLSDGTIEVGFRYERDNWNGVVSVRARPWVPLQNRLAFEIQSIRAGLVPIPLERILHELSDQFETEGWLVEWAQHNGNDVLILHLENGESGQPVLEAVEIVDKLIRISGRSGSPAGDGEIRDGQTAKTVQDFMERTTTE
jgi:hypothetical protein